MLHQGILLITFLDSLGVLLASVIECPVGFPYVEEGAQAALHLVGDVSLQAIACHGLAGWAVESPTVLFLPGRSV